MNDNKDKLNKARFISGIADFVKDGPDDSYAFGRSVDHRSDPKSIKLLPRSIKESGNVVIDLVHWFETVGTDTYEYGNVGTLYKRDTNQVYTNLRTVPGSHGNGLAYFAEDDFLYYTTDTVIGRYGPLSAGNPQFSDDFLGAQGGVPTNTASLDLEASSSQYASRADTATLSITGDIAIEAQIAPESLPSAGNQMVLVSKWDESGALRSYKFDIAAISGFFGDGSDGALTIAGNTTEAPIDSACSGTSGAFSLSATNASFAANQIIFIHQTKGTDAGTWQRNQIASYAAGTITLVNALNYSYTSSGNSKAQVRVLLQHTNVTVNSGVTYTAKAWNGTTGGILAFIANGTVTVDGTISAKGGNGTASTTDNTGGGTGGGFRGGNNDTDSGPGAGAGEGTAPNTWPIETPTAQGNGGGGAATSDAAGDGADGGNGTAGVNSGAAQGGAAVGSTDLTTMSLGGGGGGARNTPGNSAGGGGAGGGIVLITGTTITVNNTTGTITAKGGDGGVPAGGAPRCGGAGAGGSVLLKGQVINVNTNRITAIAGARSTRNLPETNGIGRIHADYYTSVAGTTTPTLNSTQDSSLVTNVSYQLRLSVSTNGSNSETLARVIPSIQLATWQHAGVSFDASAATARFCFNGVDIGSTTGTFTSIHDNASTFQIGMSKNGAGAAANFYDGLIDEVRLWASERTQQQFLDGINTQIAANSVGLNAYYRLNSDYLDETANNNDLAATGGPVFSSSVPFPSPTTRLDIDQSGGAGGSTYTLPTAISETAANRKTFTPTKDPQKSIAVQIAAVGTGNWTLTVHDAFNDTIASKTVANASLSTGLFEFIFDSPWRPLINQDYHFHLTSTVADGTVVTSVLNDLTTVTFVTFFQFLVTDTQWHPIARFLNFLVFGNERYIGKYEATLYEPNFITLEAGYRVRCFAYWREYLAIGVVRGASITANDSGRIYFWDGIAPTFNYYIDVPEGGINAMLGSKGKLFVFAGYQLDLLEYQGGDYASKIKRMPKVTPDTFAEIYPGALTMWKTLLRIGVAGNSDSGDISKGVYTWGSLNERYPVSLGNDYPPSTGNYTGTNLRIGATTVVGQKLLFSWQDNVSYGVDYIDDSNPPFTTGTIEFLVDDANAIWKQKAFNTLLAVFQPLVSGQTVTVKYRLDDDTAFTSLAETTVGATQSYLVVGGDRYQRRQVAVDLATTTTTSPVLLALTSESDILLTERKIG